MYALVLQAGDTGLTLKEVILNIPHDAGAAVVYGLTGLFVFCIWYFSRPDVIERYAVKRVDAEDSELDADAVDLEVPSTAQAEDYSTSQSLGGSLPANGRVVVYSPPDFADRGIAR